MSDLPPPPGQFRAPKVEPDDRLGIASCDGDPLVFLEQTMDNKNVSFRARMAAAIAMLPYKYAKLGEDGKKGKQQSRAQGAAEGRFKPRSAPGTPPPPMPH